MTASPRRARRNALLLGGLAALMYLGVMALQYARVHHG
jgi:hypothetical protein